ncbi:ABC transporter substrate-binding protein [Plantactinospora sp. KLBMP9567]|uniref:ABC transporter substrate-binding protein n=1 Tax=Plantactinospora sp. KLBMP9567 TaxID=3085900 RepID=UPI002981200A|nr:ABC transporter substrate-binding protein [Plantactinospora sp. KLBMP9567]MDW5325074.1 ABC transporter substrate-binding protein [Plantactinospora sp. KLBMP9567]MDW5329275.1 ABC transporter substrate-binding protein [Plantactinospora sp. KLBMP9567]
MPFPTGTSRRRALTGALLALGLTVAGSACNSGDGAGGTPGTIKIGLLASLSGTYEAVGTEIRDGFELYLRMHDGKLGGHKVDLIVADEGNGAQTAVPAATKLIKQDRVQALTGIVGGGSVAGVAPVLAEAKIPFVGSNGNPGLKDVSRSWFTSYLSDEPGAAIAEYVRDNVKGEVFAIGPNYQGGWDELRGFTDTFKEIGGKLANPDGKTLWTPFPQTTNFLPYFAKIKASGAEAVFTFYAGTAAVDFVKQYAQSEIKDLPLYAAGFLTEGGVLNAQGEAARNIYSVLNYSPDLDNAENRSFVAAWKENHDGSPTTYAMASYDAAAVLDKAIGAAGDNPTPEEINKAIAGLGQIDSPRGTWQFSKETHSPVQKWYLRQVRQDGRALSNTVVGDLATVGG